MLDEAASVRVSWKLIAPVVLEAVDKSRFVSEIGSVWFGDPYRKNNNDTITSIVADKKNTKANRPTDIYLIIHMFD